MKDGNLGSFLLKLGLFCLIAIAFWARDLNWYSHAPTSAQSVPTVNVLPEASRHSEIYQRSQSATVRVVKADSAGSGVIINRNGNIYSVLTNWHVVDSSNPIILTVDNEQHQLVEAPQQVANADLAVLQFYSEIEYFAAQLETTMPQIGDTVYAAGFPLEIAQSNSLDLGNKAFRFTQGKVSIIPVKSFPQGYQLGYTNDTEMGMSGSPVFNAEGLLVAIHGRGKYRDPGFGVYIFEDGSEPPAEQLEQMVKSSWGIPIGNYSELFN
ncbi:MAG TPA: serine protease [Coleofasciculaceae cyanobacterium]|jgi:S1-C subfamily serine protease